MSGAQSPALTSRMRKELRQLLHEPGPGVSAWAVDEADIRVLGAAIKGPDGSPFDGGTFALTIQLSHQYPFEPPLVRFVTPIYHPNIDSEGRICLDLLKSEWTPSSNINNILLSIRMLMESPNGQDGLVADITEEFNRDINLWRRKAREFTQKHAVPITATGHPAAPRVQLDTKAPADANEIGMNACSNTDGSNEDNTMRLQNSSAHEDPTRPGAFGVGNDEVTFGDKEQEEEEEEEEEEELSVEEESRWSKITSTKRIQRLYDKLLSAKRIRTTS
jgi:ubiquitin-protein ligase